MEKKAFDLIAGRTEKVLDQQGFKRQKEVVRDEEHGDTVLFIGENSAYSITYNKDDGKFELRTTLMIEDEGPDEENWKAISSWIFNPETDTVRDAESIADDFCNTLDDSKRRAAIRAAKRKATARDSDNNPGPVFFFKRLVNVIPELREEIAIERESYEDFRAVTFAKASVVPRVNALAKKKGSAPLKKLSELMEEFYNGGDLDVRSIITMVILNGIDADARQNVLDGMSASFQKYYRRCLKYKDKTVRPERIKRKASSRTSSTPPERLSGIVPKEYRKK